MLRPFCRSWLALLLVAGCFRSAAPDVPAPPEPEREVVYRAEATLTVRIVNHSQLDAVIYLLHDGVRDRLGSVTASGAGTFTVRSRVLTGSEFALLADPVGSYRTVTSEQVSRLQGTLFIWTLESDFSRGSVMVQ